MSSPPGAPARPAATLFFVVCFGAILYYLYEILQPFVTILIWASVLTVVSYPLFGKLVAVCRGRRGIAATLSCVIVLLMLVIPVVSLSAAVARQSLALYHQVESSLGTAGGDRLAELEHRPVVRWGLLQVERWFGIEEPHLREGFDRTLQAVSRFLVARGPDLLRGAGEFVFSFLLMFISMFFLFRDGPALLRLVRELSPLPMAYETELLRKFRDVSYAAVFGSLMTAAVQGLAGALLFLGLGIPSPLFWGSLVAFVSLVPIVGAFLVWVPWSGFLLLAGEPGRAAAMLAVGGVVVSGIDNVLKPVIIRGRTDMHPLLVFLSVLGGMQAFGFIGILLGPLVVALFLSFLDFYRIEFRDLLEYKLRRD